eukprot:tig00021616_g22925.t1
MELARVAKREEPSVDVLAQYFHLPINEAAKRLSMCCTSLKKLCRKHGIKRWPHRKIKSLDKAIAKLEDMKSLADQKQRVKYQLSNIRTALMRNPYDGEQGEGSYAEGDESGAESENDESTASGEDRRAPKRRSEPSNMPSNASSAAPRDPRQLPSVRDLLSTLDESSAAKPAPSGERAAYAHGSPSAAAGLPRTSSGPAPAAASELPVNVDSSFGESFHRLFGLSLVPYGVLATTGQLLTANPALQSMLGYREAELRLRSSLASIASHEDREAVANSFRTLLAGGVTSLQLGLRLVHREGHLVWTLTNMTLVRDNQECPAYFIASFQDMNALKKSCFGTDLGSMKQMTEQLRCAFDFAAVAIVLLTPEGRVQLANPTACNLFGYGTEEFVGRSVEDMTHPEDVREGLDLRSALVGCNAASNLLFNRRLLDKHGRTLRAHVMLYRHTDAYGRLDFYIAQFKLDSPVAAASH